MTTNTAPITIADLADEMGVETALIAGMAHQLADEDGAEAIYAEMTPATNISGRHCSHGALVEVGSLMVDSGQELTATAADEIRAHFAEWFAAISS